MNTTTTPPDSRAPDDDDQAPSAWTTQWRQAADVQPPAALEARLLAAFDARRPQGRRPVRRWVAGLALAAGVALAALLGQNLQRWAEPMPTVASAIPLEDAPLHVDIDALREIDRALMHARVDAAADTATDFNEKALWQARDQLLSPPHRDAGPLPAVDPMVL